MEKERGNGFGKLFLKNWIFQSMNCPVFKLKAGYNPLFCRLSPMSSNDGQSCPPGDLYRPSPDTILLPDSIAHSSFALSPILSVLPHPLGEEILKF
jgi:hypothetical protein